MFTDGATSALSFAVDFNHNSNVTYDKIWVPFSDKIQVVYDTPGGFSILTRIKPTVVSDLGTSTTPGPAPVTNNIVYEGGAVLNKYKIQIWNIFWGSGWNDTNTETWWRYATGSGQNVNGPSIRSAIITGMQNIANSEYWDGLWSYGGRSNIKGISIGGNITNTTTPYPMSLGQYLPSTGGVAGLGAEPVILDERAAGHIPNWDINGEAMTDKDGNAFPSGHQLAGSFMDYKHIYFVHLDPRHLSQEGTAGFAWKSWTPGNPPGTVNYLYNVLQFTAPEQTTDFTPAQHSMNAWCHELFHHIGETAVFGICGNGIGGFSFRKGSECTWISHSSPGCQSRIRRLASANSTTVPSYWSDIDGRCIAPATGENWTRPPATTPTGSIIRRYIFQKMDDLDNGATAAIGTDGAVYFNVKKNAIEYKIKSAAGVIKANEWVDLWFAFNNATNSPKIFVNNVLYTTPSTEVLLWNNTHSHLIIGNYNMGATVGQLRAAMDDFRMYRNSVVTSDQVDNVLNNGLTVTDVDVTQERGVAIVNRTRLNKQLENTGVFVGADAEAADVPATKVSFTTDSFTSTSFTT
jgi:hypothetical protein